MRTTSLVLTLVAFVAGAAGCGQSFRTTMADWVAGPKPAAGADERHRVAYRRDGDPEAIRFLLGNRVQSGMSVGDVEETLGMQGERVHDADWKNQGGTRFQVTDTVYKWGPDADGRSYYLVFRDGLLANFDRREYR